MVKKVRLQEILDSPRLFTPDAIKQTSIGFEIEILISGHVLSIYTMSSLAKEGDSDIRELLDELPSEFTDKMVLHSVNFALDNDLLLQKLGDPKLTATILSQVVYFINDIVRPCTLIELFPIDRESSRLKAYSSFAKNIHRFIPTLHYLPYDIGIDTYFVATSDIVDEFIVREHPQESLLREVFDSAKSYSTIDTSQQGTHSTQFKVGLHKVNIYLSEDSAKIPALIRLLSQAQGLNPQAPYGLADEHKQTLRQSGGLDYKIYDFGFTVDGNYASGSPLSKGEGHIILGQVVNFLRDTLALIGAESYSLIKYYPYTPGNSQIKSYRTLYTHIAKIVPGLVPVYEGLATYRARPVPEFLIATVTAFKLFEALKDIPLQLKSYPTRERRVRELFDSKVTIEWHPDSDSDLQVAFFTVDNLIYIFRAQDSQKQGVGFDYINNDFELPMDIAVWKVGFTYLDTEIFPEYTMDTIRTADLDDLTLLIDKNYATSTGQAPVVLTAIVKILTTLHKRFPEDIISFRGTGEKSRARVYSMLIQQTKRFAPDCIGKTYGEFFFVIPDRYNAPQQEL
jgi:hypothetical protein